MRVEFKGLNFNLLQGWTDITEDLPSGAPPSLARAEGVGTVQFSIAKYRSGEDPNVSIANLQVFLADFCDRNGIRWDKMIHRDGKIMSVSVTSTLDDEFIEVAYFSNGKDIVLLTYICSDVDSSEFENDMIGVNEIINSMEF